MSENIRLAFQGIWNHKMRSFLTMLGVIIGIASIIAIVSTIKGTNEQIMKSLIGAGNNNVTVSLKQGSSDYYMDYGLPAGISPVSKDQMDRIRDFPDVEDASFYLERSWEGNIANGSNALSSGAVYGIDTHYLGTKGYQVISGRPFLDSDYPAFRKVALLDETAAEALFPEGGAVGGTITVKNEPFVVVGLVKSSASGPEINSLMDYYNYAQNANGVVMIPDAVWPVIYQYDEPQNCVARAVTTNDMSNVGKEVAEVMNESVTGYSPAEASAEQDAETADAGAEEGTDGTEAGTEGPASGNAAITYRAEDMLEKAKNKQELSASTNNLLIWIASIALLVGGIGVMNIMLVSVTERTAEIGLKKALGARKKTILGQFLTESVVLTSTGGVLGVAAGIVLAYVISHMSGTPVAISVPSILIGVGFSMLIGIVFGLLPSVKAANLDPIQALQRE